jgi:mRNA-degrading endonuclease RelE of RelBE toxin-antitoxin system
MMSNAHVRISFTRYFVRVVKQLHKHYRHIESDLQPLLDELSEGKTPGDQIQGVSYTAYKVRLSNSDTQKGKSGGYRVIYYVKTSHSIYMLTIYSKLTMVDIEADEIRRLIEEIPDEDS